MEGDQAIMQQMDEIRGEEAKKPHVGDVEAVDVLTAEYSDDVFLAKLKDLRTTYASFRRTRKDGSCFYRAFGFSLLERLMTDKEELERIYPIVKESLSKFIAVGFPAMTSEDFYETFLEELDLVKSGAMTLETLVDHFRRSDISEYCVTFLRMMTSCHLKSNPDDFAPFLEGGLSIDQFCAKEVDPSYVEADHLQIQALAQAFGIGLRVCYVDRTPGDKVNRHDVLHGVAPKLHVLYRPGHYDILYESAP